MNRFFVEKIEDVMLIGGDNHSHIAYSLRRRVGDEILLFCGDGYDYRFVITDIKKNQTTVKLVLIQQNLCESQLNIHAFVSLIKHDKMSFVYQKLTELGVKQFFPVQTEFSQGKKSDFNHDRYCKVCIEACKQCGRSIVPIVNNPLMATELLQAFRDYDLVVFAYEKADFGLKEYLLEQKEYLLEQKKLKGDKDGIKNKDGNDGIKNKDGNGGIKNIAVLIGPEGGFSQNEATTLCENGIRPISLGKRILRAETAAIAVVSAIFYELDW